MAGMAPVVAPVTTDSSADSTASDPVASEPLVAPAVTFDASSVASFVLDPSAIAAQLSALRPADFPSDDWISKISDIIAKGGDPASIVLNTKSGYDAIDNVTLDTSDSSAASSTK